MSKSKKRAKQMTFQEYVDMLTKCGAEFTQFASTYPNTSYRKINRKKKQKKIFDNVYNYLYNIAMSIFKWEVPDTIDARYMEEAFINYGIACCFQSNLGKFVLPCMFKNILTIYRKPTHVQVIGGNGWTADIKVIQEFESPQPQSALEIDNMENEGKGIICYDNDRMYPFINYIEDYADRIADKIIALGIATQRLKSPLVYAVKDGALKDSLVEFANKLEENDDVIITLKDSDMVSIADVQITTNNINPAVVQQIASSINFDMNQYLEICGINTNPSPDKSEVVLNAELNSNNELIRLIGESRLKHRKKFCEKVKQHLGIDMKVELYTTYIQNEILKKQEQENKDERVGENKANTKPDNEE